MIETLPLGPLGTPPRAPHAPRTGGDDGFSKWVKEPPARVEPPAEPVAETVTVEAVETATAHDAVAGATLTLHGTTADLVASPWRLQGGWSLSYRDEAAEAEVGICPHQRGFAARRPSDPAHGSIGKPSANLAWGAPLADIDANATFQVVTRSKASATYTAGGTTDAPVRHALVAWPQRFLRWQADASGGQTAWLRDYSLDAEGAQRLVAALRCQARQDGVDLQRIMLNGHAAWRADSTPT